MNINYFYHEELNRRDRRRQQYRNLDRFCQSGCHSRAISTLFYGMSTSSVYTLVAGSFAAIKVGIFQNNNSIKYVNRYYDDDEHFRVKEKNPC